MKESLEKIDKKLLWRETFNSEDDVRRNGGIPTGVTFSDGTAVCLASNSSKIYYNKPLKGTYSVRLKLKSIAYSLNGLMIDFRGTSGLGTGYVIWASPTTIAFSSAATIYINNVVTTTVNFTSSDIIISGVPISSIEQFLSSRYSSTTFTSNTWELFEVYEGILTASEVSNLYNNRRYKPFTTKLPKILDVDAFDGVAKNRLSGGYVNGVSVPSIVNTAVTVVKDNGLNVMRFNGTTSKLDMGIYNILLGDLSLIAWIKPNTLGESNIGRIIDNTKFIVALNTNNRISVTSDGTTTVYSANSSVPFLKSICVGILRKSDGKVSIYINGVLSGSLDQVSGTPSSGSNIIIGNNTGQTATFLGNLSCKLYSGILSVNELSQIYTSEKNKFNL